MQVEIRDIETDRLIKEVTFASINLKDNELSCYSGDTQDSIESIYFIPDGWYVDITDKGGED